MKPPKTPHAIKLLRLVLQKAPQQFVRIQIPARLPSGAAAYEPRPRWGTRWKTWASKLFRHDTHACSFRLSPPPGADHAREMLGVLALAPVSRFSQFHGQV